jgi:hypothetical protein
MNDQRNVVSPMIENNSKRKEVSSVENINKSDFIKQKIKNKFFDEIKERIEVSKRRGVSRSCRLKTSNNYIEKDDSGSILFYWYDAIEENIEKDPNIVFFGKIFNIEKSKFESISVIVKNLHKKVYILPKIDRMNEPGIIENLQTEFEKLNQTRFSYIKKGKYSVRKKKYCLELPIPFSMNS